MPGMADGKGRWTVQRGPLILTPAAMTDDELKTGIAHTAIDSGWSYDDLVGELERRSRNRQTAVALGISALSAVVAAIALIVSLLR